MDKELMARLSRRGNRYDDGAMMHGELINRDGPAAIACIEALEAENSRLKAIVHGWHWLAVGPDEMGDYYTQKQLIEASKPYASPALKEVGDDRQ